MSKLMGIVIAIGFITLAGALAEPLPEVRLEMDPADLWHEETGLYTHAQERGKRWQRPARLEFHDGQDLPLSTEVAVRIHGGRSRALDQKSFRIYFDKGSGVVDHDLFGSPPTRFARVILRSAQSPDRSLHTHVAEQLFQDLGHLGSRIRPVTLTLNGRPWGIYSLRERLDDEFVTVTLGHRGPFDLIRDGEARHGRGEDWWVFLDQVSGAEDRDSPEWLAWVEANLDLASYVDWLIINAVGAAADNGGAHNLALLRRDDGPWQVIMWDEDDLFRAENLQNNHWRWFAAADVREYHQFQPPLQITGTWASRAPWSALFRGLLENEGFRTRFVARARELLDGELSVAGFGRRVQAEVDRLEPAVAGHAERWDWQGPDDLQAWADRMIAWYQVRHPLVLDQLDALIASFE